jgi:hypothetical protein
MNNSLNIRSFARLDWETLKDSEMPIAKIEIMISISTV